MIDNSSSPDILKVQQNLGIQRSTNMNDSPSPISNFQNNDPFENFQDDPFDVIDLDQDLASPTKKQFNRCEQAKERLSLICRKIYNTPVFAALLVIATVFALIGSQLRVIIFNKYIDPTFNVLLIICIFIFVLEIAFRLLLEPTYLLSFYFSIDVISTILIIFEMPSVYYNLFYADEEGTKYYLPVKLLKILSVLRLVRVLKLMKNFIDNDNTQVTAKKRASESKITRIIKETNMKKLIVLILIVLISIPFFDLNVYIDTSPSNIEFKARLMFPRFMNPNVNNDAIVQETIQMFSDNAEELIGLTVDGYSFDGDVLHLLRNDEWNRHTENILYDGNFHSFEIVVSTRYKRVLESILILCNTVVVTIMMILSIVSLNQDMSNLVLNPLERMIDKVKAVSLNPIQALKQKSKELDRKEMNETLIIEQAINKISQLLVLGFGQAGCKIISHLLLDSNKEIDQNVPGEKTRAIFGFCDIRQFTDATEVLLEDVMVFVNSIAEIVHHSVDSFGGAANKNIGDAFLLVWKLYSESTNTQSFSELASQVPNADDGDLLKLAKSQNSRTAEMSLLSFIQIVINLSVVPSVKKYSENEALCERIPGYKVKMGFGLHEGWAIEGAIGSEYKIDASYLSPNVNLASRLEAATKQFGVNILFSGHIYNMFTTPRLKDYCRHIDTVRVKGSIQPMKLYTIDLNIEALEDFAKTKPAENKLRSIKMDKRVSLQGAFARISKKILTNDFNDSETDELLNRVKSFEEESLVVSTLLKKEFSTILSFPDLKMSDFRRFFSFAMDAYLEGNWPLAKKNLSLCLKLKSQDGPSTTLFEFMESQGFEAPQNWDRSRELTEK